MIFEPGAVKVVRRCFGTPWVELGIFVHLVLLWCQCYEEVWLSIYKRSYWFWYELSSSMRGILRPKIYNILFYDTSSIFNTRMIPQQSNICFFITTSPSVCLPFNGYESNSRFYHLQTALFKNSYIKTTKQKTAFLYSNNSGKEYNIEYRPTYSKTYCSTRLIWHK